MKHTYYIAADGGGSKLQAVLYDESFRIVRTCRTSGVNTLFKPVEVVRRNLEQILDELLGNDVEEVASADLCLVCSHELVQEVFEKNPRIRRVSFHNEPQVALAAALQTDGLVALSGTGSDAFMISEGVYLGAVGGWGPLLGDEGSGYDIGLRALKAAIYASDGRGEDTMLLPLVMEKWQFNRLWDLVGLLAGNPDARHEVASAAALASRAANAGDRVALEIYEYAAQQLILLARTLIKRFRDKWNGTVVITGGAWKGCPLMFERFSAAIRESYPEAKILQPLFEPVVGCVVRRCLADGMKLSDIEEQLLRGFADLRYQTI